MIDESFDSLVTYSDPLLSEYIRTPFSQLRSEKNHIEMSVTFKTSWLPAKLRTVLLFQVVIFITTFALYAAVHAVRKTIGNVKTPLEGIGYSGEFFGYMNSAFMLSYSIGMVFTGILGDKFRPTTVLMGACIGVAVVTVAFGLLVTNFTSAGYWPLYVFMWVLSGLFQSCIWPVEVKLVSGWFGKSHSGALFGIWSANSSVGNILGIGLSALCIAIWGEGPVGLIWSFIMPTIVMMIVVVLVFFMPLNQQEAGFVTESDIKVDIETNTTTSIAATRANKPKVSIWVAWCLPGVIRYGLCYACIKSVNYTIFYCLTSLLRDLGYQASVAYNITILNDVGWIFGGLACGWGSDWMGYRAPFVGLFILLAVLPTALIYPFVDSTTVTAVLVTLNGFFAGGSGNVVASACCTDIGNSDALKKRKAKSTDDSSADDVSDDLIGQVSGIVDGIGAFGAAITQIVVSYLSKKYVAAVFYSLAGMLVVAFILICDLVYRETSAWFRHGRNIKSAGDKQKQQIEIDSEQTVS